jgi:hypothetical protein
VYTVIYKRWFRYIGWGAKTLYCDAIKVERRGEQVNMQSKNKARMDEREIFGGVNHTPNL